MFACLESAFVWTLKNSSVFCYPCGIPFIRSIFFFSSVVFTNKCMIKQKLSLSWKNVVILWKIFLFSNVFHFLQFIKMLVIWNITRRHNLFGRIIVLCFTCATKDAFVLLLNEHGHMPRRARELFKNPIRMYLQFLCISFFTLEVSAYMWCIC